MLEKFKRNIKSSFRSPLPYIVWAVLSIWLSVSGPFGTQDALPLLMRTLYWSGVVALSIVIGRTVRIAAEVVLEAQSEPLRRLGVAPIVALALAPVLWAYTQAFPEALPPSLLEFTGFVFLVAMGIQMIRWALAQHVLRFGTLGDHTLELRGAERDTLPRLLQRIDDNLRGALLRVSARDHYLDIYTEKGRAELLFRFSDALAELDGAEGAQVHRSHWVAWRAVAAAEREGARLFLRLVDGDRVPVSRTFQDIVAARGLLSGD